MRTKKDKGTGRGKEKEREIKRRDADIEERRENQKSDDKAWIEEKMRDEAKSMRIQKRRKGERSE